jgi:hypothetical protein
MIAEAEKKHGTPAPTKGWSFAPFCRAGAESKPATAFAATLACWLTRRTKPLRRE